VLVKVNTKAIKRSTKRSKNRNPFPPSVEGKDFFFRKGRKVPSKYLAGLQCPLRLWHQCFNPDLASPVSPAQQALFDTGHEVGQLATRLYPEGVLVESDPLRHEQGVWETVRAMEDQKVKAIYEASFSYNDVRVRVDILSRLNSGKWNLVEVKSSTRVKDEYLPDVGIQYYVLKGSGLDIDRVVLLHLNNQYVYDGRKLDLESLFISSDLTQEALYYQEELKGKLQGMKDMLGSSHPPVIAPSRHCFNPNPCEFWEHCAHGLAEDWILELAGMGQDKFDELTSMGIQDIRDVPDSFPLSEIQDRIRRCVKSNEEYVSRGLRDELEKVKYPVHFLDFETLGFAVPKYAGTRPYQSVPFQWSDHILHKIGVLEHQAYLCEEDKDPREEFARTLLGALGKKGSIVTYTNYEEGIIKGLAEDFPQYRDQLLALFGRVKDLHAIIRKNYYHPGFHGSFSLKSVVPALLPEMSYENLAIQEGQQAGLEYLRMIDSATSVEERGRIKSALLAYCGQDTLTMVKLREVLLERC
jgi:predicted RecB family nuclease